MKPGREIVGCDIRVGKQHTIDHFQFGVWFAVTCRLREMGSERALTHSSLEVTYHRSRRTLLAPMTRGQCRPIICPPPLRDRGEPIAFNGGSFALARLTTRSVVSSHFVFTFVRMMPHSAGRS